MPDQDIQLGGYYIDPRKAEVSLSQGGGYHLRQVTLDDKTPFDMGKELLSWGRFASFPDSFALHPSGHVIAVSSKYHKIQIATLPSAAARATMPVPRTVTQVLLVEQCHRSVYGHHLHEGCCQMNGL